MSRPRQFGAASADGALRRRLRRHGCVYALASWDELRALVPSLNSVAESGDCRRWRRSREPLMVPRSSEMALERAQRAVCRGRLHDALRALELVRPTDPLRGDADQLKATIQRELLAHCASAPR